MPPREMQKCSGFQLTELMVVLVILGLVLAAAVPNFIRSSSWDRVEGDARELAARVGIARAMAIEQRVSFRLVLDRPGHSYTFERQQDANTWVRDPDAVFQASGAAAVTSSANGDPDASEIVLQPSGTVQSNQAPLQVHFISARGDTGTTVLVCTGRATVRVYRTGP